MSLARFADMKKGGADPLRRPFFPSVGIPS